MQAGGDHSGLDGNHFYVLAVYFGSVGITKTRYAVAGGLDRRLRSALSAPFLIAYAFSSLSICGNPENRRKLPVSLVHCRVHLVLFNKPYAFSASSRRKANGRGWPGIFRSRAFMPPAGSMPTAKACWC